VSKIKDKNKWLKGPSQLTPSVSHARQKCTQTRFELGNPLRLPNMRVVVYSWDTVDNNAASLTQLSATVDT